MKRRLLRATPAPSTSRKGTALFAVIPIAILMMSVMVAFVGTAVETSRSSITDLDTFRARSAAKNTATLAIADLWTAYNRSSGETTGVASFKTFLSEKGMVTPEAEDSTPIKQSFMDTLGLKDDELGRKALQDVTIDRAEMFRVDTAEATSIVCLFYTSPSPRD